MQDIIQRVIDSGNPPTRQDVNDVLVGIGTSGEKRTEKDVAVRELFEKTSHRAINNQGHHVADSLDSYGAY